MTLEEVKNEYEVNPDFKEYVDRYCVFHWSKISLETALSHKLVSNVAEYYKDIRVNRKASL